jgi:hypothetical protein
MFGGGGAVYLLGSGLGLVAVCRDLLGYELAGSGSTDLVRRKSNDTETPNIALICCRCEPLAVSVAHS